MTETSKEQAVVWVAEYEIEHDPKFVAAKTREGLLIEVRKSVEKHLRNKGQEMPPELDKALAEGKNYYNRALGLKTTYSSELKVRA